MNLVFEVIGKAPYDIVDKTISFDHRGGKIGRSKKAKWTLNDPSRKISNFHLDVSYKGGQFYITDISTNGTWIKSPKKKLPKEKPILVRQSMSLAIGDYTVSAKLLGDNFSEQNKVPKDPEASSAIIPDNFFLGDQESNAFGIVHEEKPEERDIVSLLNNSESVSPIESDAPILPSLEDILNPPSQPDIPIQSDPVREHADLSTFSEVKNDIPISQPLSETNRLIDKLSSALGIDMNKLSNIEQEQILSHLIDIALLAVESAEHMKKSISKSQSQLGITSDNSKHSTQAATNPQASLARLLKSRQSPVRYLQNIYNDLDAHNIALLMAAKNYIANIEDRFSPDRLYMSFEKEGKLNKSFTNKKALAWEAYCEEFALKEDRGDKDDIDMEELANEYKKAIELIGIGYSK